MSTTMTTTIPSASAPARFSRPSTVSLTRAARICSGTICEPWLIRAAAVAYDEKALAKSSSRLPRKEGASTGHATRQ